MDITKPGYNLVTRYYLYESAVDHRLALNTCHLLIVGILDILCQYLCQAFVVGLSSALSQDSAALSKTIGYDRTA